MEAVEIEDSKGDFCELVLSQFGSSTKEEHQHLCAVIGAMSQEFKDHQLSSTPIAYLGATCSSLDRVSSEQNPPTHVIEALLTILSMLLPKIPSALIYKHKEFLSKLILRSLQSPASTVGAATSGLKCIPYLLIAKDSDNWSDMSHLYGVLLGFATDSRPKVRKQSHVCLCDVLRRFQGKSLLTPMSEAIMDKFEKLLLLAGGSNTNVNEGPKAAQEVLYMLDALMDSLPLLTMKYTTNILKYFKRLLELMQPIITRKIADTLNILSLSPSKEVSAEPLCDLLCSDAFSVSAKTSAENIAFTPRLLSVGMQKVYSLNRQICVARLPVVFNALKDILGCEHEEASRSAMEAFKNLMHACIDDNLIKQGVDQIMMEANKETRRSGPTIIEKLCATIESLLDYRFREVFDLSFQVVSAMFDKFGNYSTYLLKGTLTDLQKLARKDCPFQKELYQCLGSALGAMGPETFLDLLPFNLETESLYEENKWIFPVLKQHIVGARLSFFTGKILGLIRQTREKSRELELKGQILLSRKMDQLVNSFWSLLPSFCNYPLDTSESFKDLNEALCIALNEEPNVRGVICHSLQILIHQNKRVVEGNNDHSVGELNTATQQAMGHYSPQVATANLTVLRSSAHGILSVLSGIFLNSTKDDGGSLRATIGELASISDKDVVSRFFTISMKRMKTLLEVTREAGTKENSKFSNSMQIVDSSNDSSPSLQRAQLIDLAASFLPGLNSQEIDTLFVVIKVALQDDEGLFQKKGYKALSMVLKNCDNFLSSKLEELLELMMDVLPSCHFSAKRHRLDCLYFLIVHVSKDGSEPKARDIISSFLTEIILALKEANKKTRNRAYDILVQIGQACMDEEKGGKRENLHHLFNMVVGGLAGETPRMISAAMKGLARLTYEFSDLVSAACDLLPSTLLLLQRRNREIIKANLGFLKVLVAKSRAEGLYMHLTSLVGGLLKWQDHTKNHFKAKVKLLFEMLVKKCGLDAVKAVMPEKHMKLLTNIRKMKERKEKKLKSEEAKSQVSKATTSRISRWNHTKIFSDTGDENEDSDTEYTMDSDSDSGLEKNLSSRLKSRASSSSRVKGRTFKRKLPENLSEQFEDEPLDLLDRHKTRSALEQSRHLQKNDPSSDDLDIEIDPEGRLIISEEENTSNKKKVSSNHDESDGRSIVSASSSRKIEKKKRMKTESGWAYTGHEYASKKAGGDVSKKDKVEPYAYWPLDRKMMSRRPEHRAAARKGMASVVKMTKKLQGKSASALLSSKKGLKFKRGVLKKKGK